MRCLCPLLRHIKENQLQFHSTDFWNSLSMQALPYFLRSFSNECSWKFMPAHSLDGIIRVSICKMRGKLNHLFVCFFEIFSFCTICHNPPLFFNPHKQTVSPPTGTPGMWQKLPSCKSKAKRNQKYAQQSQNITIFSHLPTVRSSFPRKTHVYWCYNCPSLSKHPCLGPQMCHFIVYINPWAIAGEVANDLGLPLLSIGPNTDILPLTSIKPLSHNMLPCSASWFVFKWSSSHKSNDSLQFYKHIHVCCQTHELVFCRLLQESNH